MLKIRKEAARGCGYVCEASGSLSAADTLLRQTKKADTAFQQHLLFKEIQTKNRRRFSAGDGFPFYSLFMRVRPGISYGPLPFLLATGQPFKIWPDPDSYTL
jgi:hypothetical protein